MKIISAYEKKASIHFSPIVKSKLKSDIATKNTEKYNKQRKATTEVAFNLLTYVFEILCIEP